VTAFNDRWTEYGAWKKEISFLLRLFSQWLKANALLDPPIEDRIKRLESKVRSDKMMVAFVSEFSHGKSELINAIFFAAYGRRILPASAELTTMCPTEIGYESELQSCLRLLPIETRLQAQSLADWRATLEAWSCVALNVNEPEQLARTLLLVTETIQVTRQAAQALGFWQSQTSQDASALDERGMVQIPKWRRALVNIAHPPFEQGLVILDTPSFKAFGSQPELGCALLLQADAVIFILSAETGVTPSDLQAWKKHLVTEQARERTTLVVLNNIDLLWDELSTPEQIQKNVQRQTEQARQALGPGDPEILAVSAREGLVAKFNKDPELLQRSGIIGLESALAQRVLVQGQKRLCAAVHSELIALKEEINRSIHAKQLDFSDQLVKLNRMEGEIRTALAQMARSFEQEQKEFEAGCHKFTVLTLVRAKRFQGILRALDYRSLRQEMTNLHKKLVKRGLKLGAKGAYEEVFERVRITLREVQAMAQDIHAMHAAALSQINAQSGSILCCGEPPLLEAYLTDLDLAEFSHNKYMGVRNLIELHRAAFTERRVDALHARLKQVFESASADMVRWRASLNGTFDAQMGLQKTSFTSKIAAVQKVNKAADRLQIRRQGLTARLASIGALERTLEQQIAYIFAANEDAKRQTDGPPR